MMTSWQIQCALDASTRAAAARPTRAGILFSCPRATPSDEQRQIVRACAAHVRRLGLPLPDPIGVYWVEGFGFTRIPACVRVDHRRRTFDLAVNTETPLGDLVPVILHELKHLSDAVTGEAMTREASELGAEAFAMRHAQDVQW